MRWSDNNNARLLRNMIYPALPDMSILNIIWTEGVGRVENLFIMCYTYNLNTTWFVAFIMYWVYGEGIVKLLIISYFTCLLYALIFSTFPEKFKILLTVHRFHTIFLVWDVLWGWDSICITSKGDFILFQALG